MHCDKIFDGYLRCILVGAADQSRRYENTPDEIISGTRPVSPAHPSPACCPAMRSMRAPAAGTSAALRSGAFRLLGRTVPEELGDCDLPVLSEATGTVVDETNAAAAPHRRLRGRLAPPAMASLLSAGADRIDRGARAVTNLALRATRLPNPSIPPCPVARRGRRNCRQRYLVGVICAVVGAGARLPWPPPAKRSTPRSEPPPPLVQVGRAGLRRSPVLTGPSRQIAEDERKGGGCRVANLWRTPRHSRSPHANAVRTAPRLRQNGGGWAPFRLRRSRRVIVPAP